MTRGKPLTASPASAVCQGIRSQAFVFLLAFFFGALLAVVWLQYDVEIRVTNKPRSDVMSRHWPASKGFRSILVDDDEASYGPNFVSEAQVLSESVDILCAAFVRDLKTGRAVRDTWGRRCNEVVFFGRFEDAELPVISIEPVSSWHMLCDALRWIWKRRSQKLQWVLVVSDNTYVLPENLRYYLASMNYSSDYYLGHAMQFWGEVYNAAQGGYVLSRGVMTKFFAAFNTTESCVRSGKYWKNEDWYLGKHLSKLGIKPRDTRDSMGRGRFNTYSFTQLLFPGTVPIFSRYWRDSLYPTREGSECCSSRAITYHGIEPSKMYLLEYFLYHVRPFRHGGIRGNRAPPSYPDPVRVADLSWGEVTTPKNFLEKVNSVLDF